MTAQVSSTSFSVPVVPFQNDASNSVSFAQVMKSIWKPLPDCGLYPPPITAWRPSTAEPVTLVQGWLLLNSCWLALSTTIPSHRLPKIASAASISARLVGSTLANATGLTPSGPPLACRYSSPV
jgi:hypothetical protein